LQKNDVRISLGPGENEVSKFKSVESLGPALKSILARTHGFYANSFEGKQCRAQRHRIAQSWRNVKPQGKVETNVEEYPLAG